MKFYSSLISRLILVLLIILMAPWSTVFSANKSATLLTPANDPYYRFVPLFATPNNSIFGSSVAQIDLATELTRLQASATRWMRLELVWKSVEASMGTYDWSQANSLDQAIVAARQAGIQTVLLVNETPAWAVKPGFSCGVIAEDRFVNFADFVKEVIRRYSAAPYYVKYFEIYNEPDAAGVLGCWGNPSDTFYYGGAYYGQMLQSVYPVVKSAYPNAQLLVGGLLLDCDPINPPDDPNNPGQKKNCTPARFLDGILASGAGNSFDGIAFHSYDYYSGPGIYSNINWHSSRAQNGPANLAKSAYIRDALQRYGVGVDKPLLNTEYAIFCGGDNDASCLSVQDALEATKAYYIVQFMASAMADGYQTAIWYSTYSTRNNSLFQANLTPLPVYYAYKFTNQKLGNARYLRQISDLNFVIYEFSTASGRIWITWTKDSTAHTLILPALPKAIYRIGTDGNPVVETPALTLNLDQAPAIIELNP